MIRTITTHRSRPLGKGTALLLSASAMALASMPAQAADVLFSSTGQTQVAPGQRTVLGTGVLQLRLDNGATLSFTQGAEFTLNADGTLDLHKGSVTVAGAGDGQTLVRMPEGVEGRVGGTGNAASFTVRDDGESNGHTLTGTSTITRGRTSRDFAEGQMWESSGRSGIRRVLARASQETPAAAPAATPAAQEAPVEVADLREGGPVAAAQNGLPVSLGDGLAAAGASADLVALGRRLDAANGNPALDTYPAGDLARLVALAAGLERWNGGQPFPAAQADVIRTYLRFLANGGAGAQFVTAYAGFLTQYLDLIRAGGTPSQFGAASQADINAFLAYQSRLGRLGQLSAQNRALAEAYLAFVRGGGNPDLFAAQYTDLVEAYFAFVRGGGNPLEFAGASQEVLDAYIAFLGSSGLAGLLSQADQAILAAYLENGSFAFAGIYAEALQAYFTYLQRGGLPSEAEGLTPAQLRAYLELLDNAGLFAQLLDEQAPFYAAYQAFLQGGGDPDDFGQLNANIFAGYATQLQAYFAFLQGGGLPSAFAGDPDLLAQYLAALDNAEALEAFLGANAGFFAQYLAFLQGGGDIDLWTGLNANIFAGYAQALDAYFTFLAQGGLPSQYDELTQEQIAAYVAALQAQGATSAFLAGLADFYTGYLAYLQGGGDPDLFTGLPTLNLPAFADALNAYAAFLAGGGLPGDYDAASLSLLAIYLDALGRSGQLEALLGSNADLLDAFFAFLAGGGNADLFSGLPLYATYASALQAYFAFLDGGGLPGDYTTLTPQQIQSYLAALSAAGGFASQLGTLADFYTAYFAYLSTGGNPNGFSGLPLYADYVSALNAYFAFLDAGGLPGDYTVLTPQQIADYLAALNGAGGFAAFGSLNSFFTQYFAFIAGGGNPANFTGLPVYADYVAALNAFYAFLAAGGVPSAYTLLTQQQIADYLAALNAAGGFAAYGSLNAFFVNYYAYLAGGGVPDNYTSLPGMGGGTITPPVTLAYSGGFNPAVARINFVTSLSATSPGSESGFDATSFTLNSSGGLTAYTRTGGTTRTSGSTTISDVSGNADVLIGRWHSGTNTGANPFTLNANQGFHYMLARPVADTFALPTQGRIDYELLAATRPTIVDGSVAPGGITADMAILLGASPKLAFEATLTIPGAGGGANQTFSYATTGGLANADQSTTDFALFPNKSFQLRVDGVAGTNCNDVNTCYFQANGQFGGDQDTIGITYTARNDQGSAKALIGAVIFGNGTLTGGPATSTLRSNQALAYANKLIGTDSYANVQVRYDDATGAPVGFVVTSNEQIALGTASVAQHGNAGSTLYWSRWNSGTPSGTYFGDTPGAIGANGSYHMISGTPATSRPASGTLTYSLAGSTAPTFQDERTAPGTLTGSAAVAFGTTARLGLNLDVAIGGQTYNVATAGGVTTPSSSAITIAADNTFDSPFNSLTVTTTSSFCTPNCSAFVDGFLAGTNASHIGLAYAIRNNSNPQTFIDGTAAFVQDSGTGGGGGGGGTGGGSYTSDFTGTRNSIVYYAFTNGSLATGFGGSATLANGALTTLTSLIGTTAKGTTTPVEAGDVGAMAWARWTNGSVETTGLLGNSSTAIGANGGYHVMAGTAATGLPASGTVQYDLIATTAATDNLGSTPGTIEGDIAIAFGAAPKVGYEFIMAVGGRSWRVATPGGGSLNPGNGIALTNSNGAGPVFGGQFGSTNATVTGGGGACQVTCSVNINGVLYGTGGTYAGVAMGVIDASPQSGTILASGMAMFQAAGSASGTASATGAAPPEWDRWDLSSSGAIAQGNGMVAMAPGLDQLAGMGVQFSAEQMVQLDAWMAAQRVN